MQFLGRNVILKGLASHASQSRMLVILSQATSSQKRIAFLIGQDTGLDVAKV